MDIQLENKIKKWASTYALPFKVVKALVLIESGGDTWAVRFEKKWRWYLSPKTWAKLVQVSEATETVCQQMSWGLCQVMGSVSRELGHSQDISQLCDPDTGLKYGCIKLKNEIDRWGSLEKGLAAYNAGNPNSKMGKEYALKVMRKVDEINQV